MLIFLVVLFVIGISVMYFGHKNIVKSIGFWLVGFATVFIFLFLLIVMYFSTSPTPSNSYILEDDIVIEENMSDDK
jgi:hypothetical protein